MRKNTLLKPMKHSNKKPIYADYAATTPISAGVLDAMRPYLTEHYGNPSSLHYYGRKAQHAIDEARAQIATILRRDHTEIIFTATATESINTFFHSAILEAQQQGIQKPHIITTTIEHSAVLEACRYAEQHHSATVRYISPDSEGIINPQSIQDALTKNTVLVSIGYANNEIGTVQPMRTITSILKNHPTLIHTDATQAIGYCNIQEDIVPIHAITFSAHKIYGPKGIGLLYIKKGTPIHSLIVGGKQEHSHRAGTENVAAIVGFAKALAETETIKQQEYKRQKQLQNTLITDLLKNPAITLNGSRTHRLPNNIHISIENIKNDSALPYLDDRGICVATGSACTSNTPEPSHVLIALGRTEQQAKSGIRITIGRNTTQEEVRTIAQTIHTMTRDIS